MRSNQKNSCLDVPCSLFKNAMDNQPKDFSLLDFLTDSPKYFEYKQRVLAIRKTFDKRRRSELKKYLLAITPSGLFAHKRTQNNLEQHTGFICIDIDLQDNTDTNMQSIKTALMQEPCTAYVGLSASGKGLFALIRIAYPKKHLYHFEALKQDFQRYNVTIDKQCGDITRLRFYSYDKNAYFNHSAKWYDKVVFPAKPLNNSGTRVVCETKSMNNTTEKVLQCIRQIQKNGTDITADYDTWFKIGCSFASEFGENGREMFHQVSMYHSDYTPTKTDRQYNHCLKHAHRYGISIGTFFYECKVNGII